MKGRAIRMEYRIERKTGNMRDWLDAAGKKLAGIMELLRNADALREEETLACERAELEAETAAIFREIF